MTNQPLRDLTGPKLSIALPALLFASLCSGCASVPPTQQSGSTSPVSPPTTGTPTIPEHLVLLPESLTIRQSESWGFTAAMAQVGYPVITHIPEPVSWSIQEGAAGGSISADGVYTAPSVEGVYHVAATSTTDPTMTATTSVTVGRGLDLSGDSKAARIGHTATLLPGGQVIIAGGVSQSFADLQAKLIVDRADQYDPTTAVFQFVANVTRVGHTATLLPIGDLLFLGGSTEIVPSGPNVNPVTPVATASAEILKAGTGIIQPAADMSIARSGHTATLLPDGRILITGGDTPLPSLPHSPSPRPVPNSTIRRRARLPGGQHECGALRSSCDPAPDWQGADSRKRLRRSLRSGDKLLTPTGSPTIEGAGAGSTATLLPDGRVLVAGGSIARPAVLSFGVNRHCRLYDPATGQFAPAGKMTMARSFHTATLLPNGTVIIAGGITNPLPPDEDFEDAPVTNATEIFDPGTNTFSPGQAMETQREGHTATLLLDGTILFVGGCWETPNTSTEIFH